MTDHPLQLLWSVVGYFIGSIPFGFLAGKMRGIDIREHGSGNIGATNVLRTLGKPVGITVLIFDIAKGVVPVLLAKHFSDSSIIPILAAVATIRAAARDEFFATERRRAIAAVSRSNFDSCLVNEFHLYALTAMRRIRHCSRRYKEKSPITKTGLSSACLATESLFGGRND